MPTFDCCPQAPGEPGLHKWDKIVRDSASNHGEQHKVVFAASPVSDAGLLAFNSDCKRLYALDPAPADAHQQHPPHVPSQPGQVLHVPQAARRAARRPAEEPRREQGAGGVQGVQHRRSVRCDSGISALLARASRTSRWHVSQISVIALASCHAQPLSTGRHRGNRARPSTASTVSTPGTGRQRHNTASGYGLPLTDA